MSGGAALSPGDRRHRAVRRVLFADGAARAGRVRARARVPPGDVRGAAAVADDRVQRDVQVVQLVHPARGAVLPAHGEPDERRGHHRPTCPLVARPRRTSSRRARAGQRRAVDLLRRHFRLVDGGRREPGQDLHRGAGQGGLRPVVLGRDHRGLRRAGGDHPAVDPDDRLGRHADGVDRRAVPRGHRPRTPARHRADGDRPHLREDAQLSQVSALDVQGSAGGDVRRDTRR